jgi:hypothetical protein
VGCVPDRSARAEASDAFCAVESSDGAHGEKVSKREPPIVFILVGAGWAKAPKSLKHTLIIGADGT